MKNDPFPSLSRFIADMCMSEVFELTYQLLNFTSVELFCRFYYFKCYLFEAALPSLLGRWNSFSLKVPNALDMCL